MFFGAPGMELSKTGVVLNVDEDGFAERFGIKADYKAIQINGKPFTNFLYFKTLEEEKPFEMKWKIPVTDIIMFLSNFF